MTRNYQSHHMVSPPYHMLLAHTPWLVHMMHGIDSNTSCHCNKRDYNPQCTRILRIYWSPCSKYILVRIPYKMTSSSSQADNASTCKMESRFFRNRIGCIHQSNCYNDQCHIRLPQLA